MVNRQKVSVIYSMTDEVHDDITTIYELLADGEMSEGINLIDSTIGKLRALKSSIITKDNLI